jgi:hypothetical protein
MTRARQLANLALAPGMILTTVLCFATGTTFDQATDNGLPPHPITPAGYAFVIWALIYGGAVAYAVFQALPRERDNPLFRRIGWYTASAFLGTSAWLVFARFGSEWGTFGCIVWMLGSLAGAFRHLARPPRPPTAAERGLAVFPLSVFTGWVTVALFANGASALQVAGWSNAGLSEAGWAEVMLAAAALAGAAVTVFGRGNVGYAGTLIWAFVAIRAANAGPAGSPGVAGAAGAAAAAVGAAVVWGRVRDPRPA